MLKISKRPSFQCSNHNTNIIYLYSNNLLNDHLYYSNVKTINKCFNVFVRTDNNFVNLNIIV